MIRRTLIALTLGLSLAATGAAAQTAAAKATVDAAKSQGAVGEQGDGFLGLVSGSADPATKAAMAEINAGRAQAYKDIAARTGVTEAAAGEATARQLIDRLAPGAWYKPLGGSWTRK
jgi:uncharacterized protein YdbL (DUF1318 family)